MSVVLAPNQSWQPTPVVSGVGDFNIGGPERLHSTFGIMSARGQWLWGAAMAAVMLTYIYDMLPSRSAPNTPFFREYKRVHDICSKLRVYADANPSSAATNMLGKSVDELAAAGILSADDVAYIRKHQISFMGFDPNQISATVPVLETMFTNTGTPRRIVGYSDGHVESSKSAGGR